jgi:hypothetical protein
MGYYALTNIICQHNGSGFQLIIIKYGFDFVEGSGKAKIISLFEIKKVGVDLGRFLNLK